MSPIERLCKPAAAPPRAAAFFPSRGLRTGLAEGATVAEALQGAAGALEEAGIDTPRLDAEVLLAHTLGISRSELLAGLQDPLPATTRTTFEELISRRLRHEPVAYLTHHKEFYGLDFYVDDRVLIPRPGTELLVDKAIAIHNSQFTIHNPALSLVEGSQFTIADVGTGSGCIAVALAVNLPRAKVYATEVSPDALEVARINVEHHGVGDRVRLVQSDLLQAVEPGIRFDIIVANLPYVPEAELAQLPPSVRNYEPIEWALEAGPDGLNLIRRLLAQAPARLRPGGVVLLEIGWKQGPGVLELARRHFSGADVRVFQDLAGLDRAVEIQARGEQGCINC